MINPIEYIHGTYMFKVIHNMNILNEHKSYLIKNVILGNVYKIIEITNIYYKYILSTLKYIKVDLQNNYTKELFEKYVELIENIKQELKSIEMLHEYINHKFKDLDIYIESYLININKL